MGSKPDHTRRLPSMEASLSFPRSGFLCYAEACSNARPRSGRPQTILQTHKQGVGRRPLRGPLSNWANSRRLPGRQISIVPQGCAKQSQDAIAANAARAAEYTVHCGLQAIFTSKVHRNARVPWLLHGILYA